LYIYQGIYFLFNSLFVKHRNKTGSKRWNLFHCTVFCSVAILLPAGTNAQICPYNIDFETGSFNNWTCYTGGVEAVGGQNVIGLTPSGGPVSNRHTMFSGNQGSDYFGGFPVNCPNGSGHSIRLGNNLGGGQAEGISYEFTIPANQNTYSLRYHYAVVFQDPHHQPYQQPRLEIEAKNITDNEVIYCSSFTFYPFGSLLPGFYVSPYQQDTTNVWCKDWSAVTINLNGKAGKTIRLFFKTADCTFTRHFGYAYIDVDSDCNTGFIGAAFCPDDTAVTITAPFGYQGYTWHNNNFTQVLGNQQSITFKPPPPSGTVVAVALVPYSDYGCPDTLYATLMDTLTVKSNAGPDALSCNRNQVQIGANARPGLSYRWSPAAGLSNAFIANPRAGPAVTTSYVLTTTSRGGGCATTDTVVVTASIVDTTLGLLGKPAFCSTSSDSAVLFVQPIAGIQWFKNDIAITGASKIRYRATQSGAYHALLTNDKGCSLFTAKKNILIEVPRPGIRYPVKNAVLNTPFPLQARTFSKTAVWIPSTFLNDPFVFTPIFTGLSEKLYTIKLVTEAGCTTVDTQLVKIFKDINFYVPSAFTPNGDGLNDYLRPVAAGITEIQFFRIYNRWGELLFDLRSDEPGWDGNYKGRPQETQTVIWIAEGIGADGQLRKQRGSSILIR
jgi:gliding motility-associated-like protein